MNNVFATNLKTMRAEMNISQAQLAKLLNVTQQCISEWELGKTEPTLSYIWALADIFDVTMDALCGRSEW